MGTAIMSHMTYDEALKWGGGTQAKLAAKLGIDQSSVSGWGKRVPDARQIQIQKMTRGRLKADAACWDFKKGAK